VRGLKGDFAGAQKTVWKGGPQKEEGLLLPGGCTIIFKWRRMTQKKGVFRRRAILGGDLPKISRVTNRAVWSGSPEGRKSSLKKKKNLDCVTILWTHGGNRIGEREILSKGVDNAYLPKRVEIVSVPGPSLEDLRKRGGGKINSTTAKTPVRVSQKLSDGRNTLLKVISVSRGETPAPEG